jgi:uncharacterized protein YjdB
MQIRAVNETSVQWRSTVPSVASVDAQGLVTALAAGSASVWAVRGSDSASAIVVVLRPVCAASPTISPAHVTIAPGDSVLAEARENCAAIPTGFTWAVDDTSIATVEARETTSGRTTAIIKAKRPGQVAVRAYSIDDPSVYVALALTVRDP